jgi:hypothetical protein
MSELLEKLNSISSTKPNFTQKTFAFSGEPAIKVINTPPKPKVFEKIEPEPENNPVTDNSSDSKQELKPEIKEEKDLGKKEEEKKPDTITPNIPLKAEIPKVNFGNLAANPIGVPSTPDLESTIKSAAKTIMENLGKFDRFSYLSPDAINDKIAASEKIIGSVMDLFFKIGDQLTDQFESGDLKADSSLDTANTKIFKDGSVYKKI